MTWRGPRLNDDQRDVAELVDTFVARHAAELDDARPGEIDALRGELAVLGLWTMGVTAEHGGGGAAPDVTVVAAERLARPWPALAWSFVQTQVAADLLGAAPQAAGTLERLHSGASAVAVVAANSAHVCLKRSGQQLTGSVDRVDAAAENPALLLLVSDTTALFVGAATRVVPLARTGLAGALTRSVELAAGDGDVVEVTGLDVAAAHTRLRLGAAAVAAGIAGAAVDQAIDYASSRQQFGAVITAIATVRQSLFTQAARTSAALSSTLAAAAAGVSPAAAAGLLAEACQAAIDVCAMALQVHGGYGYLREYPAERYLRDAVSLRAAVDAFGATVTGARELVGLATASALSDGEVAGE